VSILRARKKAKKKLKKKGRNEKPKKNTISASIHSCGVDYCDGYYCHFKWFDN
jgi:hypothetical protein